MAEAAHSGRDCWSTPSIAKRRSRARPALIHHRPLWDQFQALLPKREAAAHPLGCHRTRIPDRVVFDKLLARLVLGGTHQQHAGHTCSATTMRARRDEWIATGLFERLRQPALEAYDEAIGLDLENLVVDGCIVKAPGGGQNTGRSPVDPGKSGLKRSVLVDGGGLPLGWVGADVNRNDSPLLRPILETLRLFGFRLPPAITVHLEADCHSWQRCSHHSPESSAVRLLAHLGQ
ncbi:transposase [Streptomyces sp. K1PN6]|uniref:Transposase n=1 Tax=Streptomyces acidicola TaxID=2596892 RepID=A0A5N8WV86_9ACTN|nr:transposase [Streptomyces acidicola]